MQTLQHDCDALRKENRALQQELVHAEKEAKAAKATYIAQEDEIARLTHELKEYIEQRASMADAESGERATPLAELPAIVVVQGGETLERELIAALKDALGDGSTWEGALGASRRRANTSPSSITAAAVRTVKRAQASWMAEHAALRDEALDARRSASARAQEVQDARETIKKLKNEITHYKRGLQDTRLKLQQAEARRLTELEAQLRSLPVPRMAQPNSDHENENDLTSSSEFAAYIQARRGTTGNHLPSALNTGGTSPNKHRQYSDASPRLPRLNLKQNVLMDHEAYGMPIT